MTVDLKRKQTTIEDFFGGQAKKSKVETNNIKVRSDAKNEIAKSETIIQTEETQKKQEQLVENSMGSKALFQKSLSSMLGKLLTLEIETIEPSWFAHMQEEFRKPYFVKLKQFICSEEAKHTIFPPPKDVYSWSRLTPFDQVKVVIIGQDPYHNFNQAHGLAFSVKSPTPAPPSLKNIYKELKGNYSDFEIDNSKGDLTPWSLQGVLLLNTALTVRAHNANSHSKQGWEVFTRKVVESLIKDRKENNKSLVFLLWGNNAIKLVESLLSLQAQAQNKNVKVFKSVHPSPLSASRGFFGNNHFKQINDWLYNDRKEKMIDWSVVPGSHLKEVEEANKKFTDV